MSHARHIRVTYASHTLQVRSTPVSHKCLLIVTCLSGTCHLAHLLFQEHFSKFTDNIGSIEWEQEDGQPTDAALGMVSNEGEVVLFSSSMRCEGPVEEWLTGLMEFCAHTLRCE